MPPSCANPEEIGGDVMMAGSRKASEAGAGGVCGQVFGGHQKGPQAAGDPQATCLTTLASKH